MLPKLGQYNTLKRFRDTLADNNLIIMVPLRHHNSLIVLTHRCLSRIFVGSGNFKSELPKTSLVPIHVFQRCALFIIGFWKKSENLC